MNESPLGSLCTDEVFGALLIINGLLVYLAIQSKDRLIKEVKVINHDLYRAILFPRRALYEADFTSIAAVFFYSRFKKAIKSRDFHELNPLRPRLKKVSAYNMMFVGSGLCLIAWLIGC